MRTYPFGSLAAQVLGYVGPVNAKDLAKAKADEAQPGLLGEYARSKPYQGEDEIGKSGVEATYERYLRGTPSSTTIQVDARGNYVTTVKDSKPKPGDDVWLTIDANIQSLAQTQLAAKLESIRGTIDKTTRQGAQRPAGIGGHHRSRQRQHHRARRRIRPTTRRSWSTASPSRSGTS